MFSVNEKRRIADAVQKILRDTGHVELPEGEIQFSLLVDGNSSLSYAHIHNNGSEPQPGVNPHNEAMEKLSKPAHSEKGLRERLDEAKAWEEAIRTLPDYAYPTWKRNRLAALEQALAATPAVREPQAEYPKPCGLCPGQIESKDDLDWHGLGNCVPICERCTGSGIEPKPEAVREPGPTPTREWFHHRHGAYLNTMVADLRIEGKGQYLRDLFGRLEDEMFSSSSAGDAAPTQQHELEHSESYECKHCKLGTGYWPGSPVCNRSAPAATEKGEGK